MTELKARFECFLRTIEGFEDIDALLRCRDPVGKSRADYLLDRRKVIVEQKTLEVDPNYRPQKRIEKLMQEGRLLAYGTVSTNIFSEDLQREIILDLTKNIDTIVAKADKQTEGTRQIFSIPSALGVLVILNERARILDPQVIHYGLANAFQKKSADGSFRYPHNDGVILIPEAHRVNTPKGISVPLLSFTRPNGRANAEFTRFCDTFLEAWAKFNRVSLIRSRG